MLGIQSKLSEEQGSLNIKSSKIYPFSFMSCFPRNEELYILLTTLYNWEIFCLLKETFYDNNKNPSIVYKLTRKMIFFIIRLKGKNEIFKTTLDCAKYV